LSQAADAAVPPELAPLVPTGAVLRQSSDPALTANKPYTVAGTLPSGGDQVVAFVGTRLFEMESQVPDGSEKAAIVGLFKHYDQKVAAMGGKRLNQGFESDQWFGINAKLHVFSVPTATGPVQFGLWIQDGGRRHFLLLFPAADTRAATATELETRIATFGSAPLYINFDTNKSDLKADGQAAVTQTLAVLKKNPDMKLSVEGHTDSVGSAETNKVLSLARANAVVAALVAQGIAASRLTTVGRGQEVPLADNRTEAGRAKNRRVELVKVK
jgi:outer membrane protein OmpA-like peptidoglycan-associated protein